MLKSFLFSSILLPQPPALYTILHQISAPTVPLRTCIQEGSLFFPITLRLYIHPTMVIHRFVRAIITYTDGVKMTRDWLIEIGLTCPEGFLNDTITVPFLIIAGKYTIFMIDNRSYQITFFICINHSLFINYRPGSGESSSQITGSTSSSFSTSSSSTGAPASPSMQHSPLQASRLQRNFSRNTSKEITTSSICIISY